MVAQKYINEWSLDEFTEYLRVIGCIPATECATEVEVAGEGNMNLTLRVYAGTQGFIVKQSVPYVAKYPSIPAPADRINKEIQFYQTIQTHPELAAKTPQVLHCDPDTHIAVIEDLGQCPDYTFLYKSGRTIEETTLTELTEWLAALHRIDTKALLKDGFDNSEMLQLNHAHIFELPFRADNGFDLEAICPGLTELAREIQGDAQIVHTAETIGAKEYLNQSKVLTHGDFYPGSILKTHSGPAIIDPEFCALGRREFDLGVFYAHLILSQQAQVHIDHFLNRCQTLLPFEQKLTQQFAGIEIIRRIIGIAQLPANFDLKARRHFLETAKLLVT
jgi:5-methylthioribose kinase